MIELQRSGGVSAIAIRESARSEKKYLYGLV